MDFYNFTKPGHGDVDDSHYHPVIRFWKHYGRHFTRLLGVNARYALTTMPVFVWLMSLINAAARHGTKTAIIQNRSVFGGNASSEVRMHIVGASSHAAKRELAETGILLEMLLENKRRNPYAVFPVFDSILWEFVRFQENLTPYLNNKMPDGLRDEAAHLAASAVKNC